MNRRRKLIPVSKELTEAIKRHESYVKRFIDPNFAGKNNAIDVEKGTIILYFPICSIVNICSIFRSSHSVWNLW